MIERFSRLSSLEMAAIALSAVFGAFLVLDPLVLSAVRALDPDARAFFRLLTNLGKANWILLSSGAAIVVFAALQARERSVRREVIYGYAAKLFAFLFTAVALSGIAATLIKNIIGRARPKLFDELGSFEFRPFTFDYDFAAFPSGHATTVGALAGVLAIIWPCARVPVLIAGAWVASTRFFIGAHYFSDAVAGFAFGLACAYFLRERLARRGWLFRKDATGQVHLRGRILLRKATSTLSQKFQAIGPGASRLAGLKRTPRQ